MRSRHVIVRLMERIPNRKRYGRRLRTLQDFLLKSKPSKNRWWQHKAVFALFGLLLFFVAVLAVMNHMEWILIIAWPLLLLSIWLTVRDIQSRPVRWTVVTALVALAGIGCYTTRLLRDRSQSQDPN